MSEEKRKLGDYEIIQSIYIGDKEVVFGADEKDPYPFMVCCCVMPVCILSRNWRYMPTM